MNQHADPSVATDHPNPARTRFVTLCQQLLVLAVVAALLTPAARTISLDVRPVGPGARDATGDTAVQAGGVASVPSGEVESKVRKVALTADPGARGQAPRRAAIQRTPAGQRITSEPLAAHGYAAVGLTWDRASAVDDEDITFQVRSHQDGAWSDWSEVPYHDEHQPEAEEEDAGADVRPGTEPVIVGEVDRIQVRANAKGTAPRGLQVSVIDPGEAEESTQQAPSIDTRQSSARTDAEGDEDLELAVAKTSKPRIFSRRQWGANEEWRDRGSLSYYEVHMGFVHHTVTGNDYSRGQVDNIIRSIYSYHTRSRGWSDIGYNFLVDRFGRIWEGRAGGVARPVVGAHTYGYNDHSFAASAIGNYETTRPSNKMVRAFGRLFGWKLSLHGVHPKKRRALRLNGNTFPAIGGHRDAGQTACPGRHLYARLDDIRNNAAAFQKNGWRQRELESNLAGDARPDLVMRRRSDGRVFVLPLKKVGPNQYGTGRFIDTGLDLDNARDIIKAGDWDRDGHGDLIVRRRNDHRLFLHRGDGSGKFRDGVQIEGGMRRVWNLSGVGDFNGDGYPDLMGTPRGGNATMLFAGQGLDGLRKQRRMYSRIRGMWAVPVGRWNRGGAPDIVYHDRERMFAYYGNGPGGLTGRRQVAFPTKRFKNITGVHNLGNGPHVDLVARERGTGELYFLPGTFAGGGKIQKAAPISLGRTLDGFDNIT